MLYNTTTSPTHREHDNFNSNCMKFGKYCTVFECATKHFTRISMGSLYQLIFLKQDYFRRIGEPKILSIVNLNFIVCKIIYLYFKNYKTTTHDLLN